MNNIITAEEVSIYGRPVSTDKTTLDSTIREVEAEDIRPRLGDAMYTALINGLSDDRFLVLLEGGDWTDKAGRIRYCMGLKRAVAYFVYARVIRDGNIQATRYGSVVKNTEYSAEPAIRERRRQYEEFFATADRYLKDCLIYLSDGCSFPEYTQNGLIKANRSRMKVLEDNGPTMSSRRNREHITVIEGRNGLSAYELAVKQGFVGTLDEWLESLKGQPGEPGRPLTWDDLTPEQKAALSDQASSRVDEVAGNRADLQTTVKNNLVAAINELQAGKMQQVPLTYSGGAIRNEAGEALGFDQISTLVRDKSLFVYLVAENILHIPIFVEDNGAVEFEAVFVYSGETAMHRVIINAEGDIKVEQIEVERTANKSTVVDNTRHPADDKHYPTTKAVKTYLESHYVNSSLVQPDTTSDNPLVNQNFVNSSIATNTANYISKNGQPFSSVAELEAYAGELTNNDYAFVVGSDQAGNTQYTRYKYNADTEEWAAEYVLNNSSFTAAQWAAITSGINATLVARIGQNQTAIAGILEALALKANQTDLTALETKVGDLSHLQTENKTNIVSAINEAYNHGGGGETPSADLILDYTLTDDTPQFNTKILLPDEYKGKYTKALVIFDASALAAAPYFNTNRIGVVASNNDIYSGNTSPMVNNNQKYLYIYFDLYPGVIKYLGGNTPQVNGYANAAFSGQLLNNSYDGGFNGIVSGVGTLYAGTRIQIYGLKD